MSRCKRTCQELTMAGLISLAILTSLLPIVGIVLSLAPAPEHSRESLEPVVSQMVDVIRN